MPGKNVAAGLCALFLVAADGSAPAQARAPAEQSATAAVAALTSSACYAVASGAVAFPQAAPNALPGVEAELKKLGLVPYLPNDAIARLGQAGTTLISRATLGSRSLPDGDVLFADGGAAGCRIVLLAKSRAGLAEEVAAAIAAAGDWRAIPEMTGARSGVQRRAFIRRDQAGRAYLLNLMSLPEEAGDLRLFTTVVRIPPNVQIPGGY